MNETIKVWSIPWHHRQDPQLYRVPGHFGLCGWDQQNWDLQWDKIPRDSMFNATIQQYDHCPQYSRQFLTCEIFAKLWGWISSKYKGTSTYMTLGCKLCEVCRLLKDWSPNNPDPSTVGCGSEEAYEWVCHQCAHVWRTRPDLRHALSSNCPKCWERRRQTVKRPLIVDAYPELAAEWVGLPNCKSLHSITAGSMQKANWQCPICNRFYMARVHDRVPGTGCSNSPCMTIRRVSPESLEKRRWRDFRKAFLDDRPVCIEYMINIHHELCGSPFTSTASISWSRLRRYKAWLRPKTWLAF